MCWLSQDLSFFRLVAVAGVARVNASTPRCCFPSWVRLSPKPIAKQNVVRYVDFCVRLLWERGKPLHRQNNPGLTVNKQDWLLSHIPNGTNRRGDAKKRRSGSEPFDAT